MIIALEQTTIVWCHLLGVAVMFLLGERERFGNFASWVNNPASRLDAHLLFTFQPNLTSESIEFSLITAF
jgi:hypothetical protein